MVVWLSAVWQRTDVGWIGISADYQQVVKGSVLRGHGFRYLETNAGIRVVTISAVPQQVLLTMEPLC